MSGQGDRFFQGEHWKGAIAGHELSEENSEEDRKRILLERFQLEVCYCAHVYQSLQRASIVNALARWPACLTYRAAPLQPSESDYSGTHSTRLAQQ